MTGCVYCFNLNIFIFVLGVFEFYCFIVFDVLNCVFSCILTTIILSFNLRKQIKQIIFNQIAFQILQYNRPLPLFLIQKLQQIMQPTHMIKMCMCNQYFRNVNFFIILIIILLFKLFIHIIKILTNILDKSSALRREESFTCINHYSFSGVGVA